MKQNETPQLSSSWWKSAQPEGLSSAKELAKALTDYEDARKLLAKDASEEAHDECLRSLGAVKSAAKSVAAEAQKLVKSPPKKGNIDIDDLGYTVEVLAKFPRVTESVEKLLAKDAAQNKAKGGGGEEDDDDDAGVLGSLDGYKEYLKKTLRRMKQTPMNFAIGLGKRPDEHRLVCHRSKPAKSLSAMIKSETKLTRMAWGFAGAHGEKPTTLTLALESPLAPGLKKKLEKQFKLLKPLAFDKVMLMVDGEEAEDIVDPDEIADDDADANQNEGAQAQGTEQGAESVSGDIPPPPPPSAPPPQQDQSAAFAARLKDLLAKLPQAMAANATEGNAAKLKASEAGAYVRKKDFASADPLLSEAEAIIARLSTPAAAPRAATGSKVVFTQSRLAWGAARTKVQAELQKLEKEILESYRDRAEVFDAVTNSVRKLDTILANFDESLSDKLDEALNAADAETHAKLHDEARVIIGRYRRFLDSDPLVQEVDDNPFVPVAVQSTLEKTLSLLESKLV